MAGTILARGQKEKLGPGRWRLRISLGLDPETGKYRRSPSRIFSGTAREADRALEEYRQELEDELANPRKALLFAEYADSFFECREILCESPLSRKSERYEIGKLKEIFGDFPIKDLTPSDIKKGLLDARKQGILTPHTAKKALKRLRMVLESAVDDGILGRNPAARIQMPEPKKKEVKPLSPEEARRLAACLEREGVTPVTVAIRLMLNGALRKGEVLGLTWADVDFKESAVFIEFQYSNDRVLRPPKSKNSRRWVPLDEGTMEMLRAYKIRQAEFVDPSITFVQEGDTPVVIDTVAGHMDPTRFHKLFQGFCVEHGFGQFTDVATYIDARGVERRCEKGYVGLTPHALRHTSASLIAAEGIDPKVLSTRLGHSSVQLTYNVYVDAFQKSERRAAKAIAKALGPAAENDDVR